MTTPKKCYKLINNKLELVNDITYEDTLLTWIPLYNDNLEPIGIGMF